MFNTIVFNNVLYVYIHIFYNLNLYDEILRKYWEKKVNYISQKYFSLEILNLLYKTTKKMKNIVQFFNFDSTYAFNFASVELDGKKIVFQNRCG